MLWADLEYSGVIDMVSPSFYPLTDPGQPSDLKAPDWAAAPANAYMVAYGNLSLDSSGMAFAGYLSDVHNPTAPLALQKIYRGAPTENDARRMAHQFADDIIGSPQWRPARHRADTDRLCERTQRQQGNLGDGLRWREPTPGVRTLRSISLTPRWSPDATRIAFTCYVPFRGVTSAQICLYSTDSNRLISFPRFRGTNASPAWSPDGSEIAFMSSQGGDPEIYVSDLSGSHLHRITFAAGVSTSPVYNPKTGKQIIFVSDRAGSPVLYESNSDGSDVQKIDLPDKGYVIDPTWSPNGQLVAFSWRRPTGNYDIYAMDVVSHQLVELTRDSGRNERPSWAPDGRHLVFESTRNGTRQIWSMLADGSQPRQLTYQGQNESPNWSPK